MSADRMNRFFFSAVLGLSLLALAACGSSSGMHPTPPGGGGGGGTPAQSAKFLFATVSKAGQVAGFTVNASTGALTPTAQVSAAAGNMPIRVASDSSGKFLYVANQGSNNVSAYTIGSDGTLTPVTGSPFAIGGAGADVVVSPSGKFVFVADGADNSGSKGISGFSIGATGALTPVPGSPFALQNNPSALAIDPAGKFLYVASGPVEAFSIDQNAGALTPIPGEPFQPVGPPGCPVCSGPTPAFDVTIDPAGAHLYTADGFSGSVDAFNIDPSSGTLTHMSGAPFVDRMPTGQPGDDAFNPFGITIEPHGKFLYGYDSGDNDISFFAIDPSTGALGPVQKTTNTFGGICAGKILRADPTGSFLYGLGTAGTQCMPPPAVLGFAINQSNGSLTTIPGEPFQSNAFPFQDGIAVVP